MATESVTTPTTDLQQFGPSSNTAYLFAVNAGIELPVAIHKASCLEDSVAKLLADGIDTGMTSETAFLCQFGLETAKALRIAAGQED